MLSRTDLIHIVCKIEQSMQDNKNYIVSSYKRYKQSDDPSDVNTSKRFRQFVNNERKLKTRVMQQLKHIDKYGYV